MIGEVVLIVMIKLYQIGWGKEK